MPFTAQEHREYREKLKKEGICTCCHKRKTDNTSTCEICKKSKQKQKTIYRQDKTRCFECSNKLGEFDVYSGRALCPRCNEVRKIRKLRRSI